MLRFRVNDFKEFIDFLNLTDSEYLDVFVYKDTIRLVNNSSQIFGKKEFPCEVSSGYEDTSFRVPRLALYKLAVPGVIRVTFIDTEICISILGNAEIPIWEFSFRKQEVYDGEYRAKLALCETLHEYEKENLACLYQVAKLSKPFRTLISVQDGFGVGFINSRVRVLKRVNLKSEFSVNADAFLTLYNFSQNIIKAKNYLAVQSADISILVTLCLPAECIDFNYTEQQKSAFKCDIELRNVTELLNKIDFKDEYLMFDFKNNQIILEKNRVQYKIPLFVFNLQCSPNYDLGTLAIPVNIFKFLIAKMGSSFKLSKRPTYVRFESEDLIVYL